MKHVIYILLTLFLLASCQKEEYVGTPRGMGTLVLETLSVQTENVNTVFTRAVEPDLYVEIWQNGQLLTGQRYEPGKVPGKLDLPAGVYLLKTYNQAYQDMSRRQYQRVKRAYLRKMIVEMKKRLLYIQKMIDSKMEQIQRESYT